MSTQMGDFLIKLSQDPILSERYREDPHGVMSGFDLTQEDVALLIDGDTEAIHKHYKIYASDQGIKGRKDKNGGKKKITAKKKPAKKKTKR